MNKNQYIDLINSTNEVRYIKERSVKTTMSRLDRVKKDAAEANMIVCTYSPGDGLTRYKFGYPYNNDPYPSYFSMESIYTASGIKEAEVYAKGLKHGATKQKGVK